MKNISKHITYKEATQSYVAIRYGIDNDPEEHQLRNMIMLAEMVFEPLRAFFNRPIGITSFYRSSALNSKLKGSRTSQHMANNGAAIDLDGDIYGGVTNKELFDYIRLNLNFDQLISEFPDRESNPAWVHVSYKQFGNRRQVLEAHSINGRILYTQYTS